jgi:hypothetical protein
MHSRIRCLYLYKMSNVPTYIRNIEDLQKIVMIATVVIMENYKNFKFQYIDRATKKEVPNVRFCIFSDVRGPTLPHVDMKMLKGSKTDMGPRRPRIEAVIPEDDKQHEYISYIDKMTRAAGFFAAIGFGKKFKDVVSFTVGDKIKLESKLTKTASMEYELCVVMKNLTIVPFRRYIEEMEAEDRAMLGDFQKPLEKFMSEGIYYVPSGNIWSAKAKKTFLKIDLAHSSFPCGNTKRKYRETNAPMTENEEDNTLAAWGIKIPVIKDTVDDRGEVKWNLVTGSNWALRAPCNKRQGDSNVFNARVYFCPNGLTDLYWNVSYRGDVWKTTYEAKSTGLNYGDEEIDAELAGVEYDSDAVPVKVAKANLGASENTASAAAASSGPKKAILGATESSATAAAANSSPPKEKTLDATDSSAV